MSSPTDKEVEDYLKQEFQRFKPISEHEENYYLYSDLLSILTNVDPMWIGLEEVKQLRSTLDYHIQNTTKDPSELANELNECVNILTPSIDSKIDAIHNITTTDANVYMRTILSCFLLIKERFVCSKMVDDANEDIRITRLLISLLDTHETDSKYLSLILTMESMLSDKYLITYKDRRETTEDLLKIILSKYKL